MLKASAVKFIAAERVAYMGKMHPYLVGPSGFRFNADNCEHAVCSDGFIFSNGRLAAFGNKAFMQRWIAVINWGIYDAFR